MPGTSTGKDDLGHRCLGGTFRTVKTTKSSASAFANQAVNEVYAFDLHISRLHRIGH